MPKVPPKDQYRMTIALGEAMADFDYRANELAFIGNDICPLFLQFKKAVGLWDNFSVSRGMDIHAWVDKPVDEILRVSRSLLHELQSNWSLYGNDYWFRGPSDWSKRRGLAGMLLADGRVGLLSNQVPGELTLSVDGGKELLDLRGLDEYAAESPPILRFYRKPNDIRWREHLAAIIEFVEAHPTEDAMVRLRHHYVNDPVPKVPKVRRAASKKGE